MKSSIVKILSLLPAVSAHYVFSRTIVDGVESSDFQYIRKNSNNYMPTKWDGILVDNFRCNNGSMDSAASTETLTLAAGSEMGMKLAYGATMKHPGPLSVFMSKAPEGTDITAYEGDGEWFKIYQTLICEDSTGGLQDEEWCTYDHDTETFTIPSDTPAGNYLVRIEHIAVHGAFDGQAEFYFTCAQVEVTGDGTGTPSPTTLIPGVYARDDPAITFNIWNSPTSYPYYPGIDVWSSGAIDGSADGTGTMPTSNGLADDHVVSDAQSSVVSSYSFTTSAALSSIETVATVSSSATTSVAEPTTLATITASSATSAGVATAANASPSAKGCARH